MSDLEPIQFSHFSNHSSMSKSQNIMTNIREEIFKEISIKVEIKKLQSPTIVLSVSSAPAASELRLKRSELLLILDKYTISNIQIVIQ